MSFWSAAAILPVIVLAAVSYGLAPRVGRRGAMIIAAVVTGAFATALTELLSVANGISRPPLALAWTGAAVASLLWARRRRIPFKPEWPRLSWDSWVLVGAAALLLAATFSLALATTPNVWDSLTYHMARVAHWAQNRNVAPYPTAILRQLHQTPFAEYAMLHAQVLTGSDIFANLVQWCAVFGTAIAVSLIVRQAGYGGRAQAFAAFFIVTTPMAAAQAPTAFNDAVVTFWLTAFVALMTMFRAEQRPLGTLAENVLLGACLGLAALTKATSYVIAFPLVVWLIASRRRIGMRALVGELSVIGAVALVLNAGFYARNIQLEGSPLGSGAEGAGGKYAYTNDTHGPGTLLSNVVRNVALHAAMPSHRANVAIQAAVERSLHAAGIDLNDPSNTWSGTEFSVGTCYDAGCAENPLQLGLIIIAFAVTLFGMRSRGWSNIERPLSLSVVAGFLLFCFVFKWQPWHSRLHLPLFALSAPVVAAVLEPRLGRRSFVALGSLLFVSALPPILFEPTHPLINGWGRLASQRSVFLGRREDSYLAGSRRSIDPLRRVVRGIGEARCTRVALLLGPDSPEYAFWGYASAELSALPRIEQVNVTNASAKLSGEPRFRDFAPCALVTFDVEAPPALEASGITFHRVDTGPVTAVDPRLYLRGDR